MKKRTLLLGIAMLILTTMSVAQEIATQPTNILKPRKWEVGLSSNSFDMSGLYIKRRIPNANMYLRLDSENKLETFKEGKSIAGTIGLSLEKHLPIAPKLDFYHGVNLSFLRKSTYNATLNSSTNIIENRYATGAVGLGIGYKMGIEYHLNSRFAIHAEANPMLVRLKTQTGNMSTTGTFIRPVIRLGLGVKF